MISKKIYYCWFGNSKKSKLIRKCIKSWQKYCIGYEIIEINERNFDVSQNLFCSQAYKAKKYAYVADYARAKTVFENGGLYLDCDVQLLKSLDTFLDCFAFIGVEHSDLIESYLFGAERHNRYIELVLKTFDEEQFIDSEGKYNYHTMPERFTECFKSYYQCDNVEDKIYKFEDLNVYPAEFFQPIDFRTEEIRISSNTYAIHHYSASWYGKGKRFIKMCSKLLPRRMRLWLRKLVNKERK